MPRIKLSSKPMMGVVTCVVKSDMFVDRLRIVSVFLLSFRMPYRKRDQVSRSYSLSWMWIQNHVQEKNKKKYPFLNKHQTCQDMTCQYKAELKLQSRTLNLGHTAPGTYFSLFQSCFVCFFGGIVQFEANIEREREKMSRTTCQHHSFNWPKF